MKTIFEIISSTFFFIVSQGGLGEQEQLKAQ